MNPFIEVNDCDPFKDAQRNVLFGMDIREVTLGKDIPGERVEERDFFEELKEERQANISPLRQSSSSSEEEK